MGSACHAAEGWEREEVVSQIEEAEADIGQDYAAAPTLEELVGS